VNGGWRFWFAAIVGMQMGVSVSVAQPANTADPSTARKLGIGFEDLEPKAGDRGARAFQEICAKCHERGIGHAPAVPTLRQMTPASIYRVLTVGSMRAQAEAVSDADKTAVAEYLAGKNVSAGNKLSPPECKGLAAEFDFDEPPVFPAWGLAVTNTRYLTNDLAGINPENLGRLTLKWALGVAGGTRMRSHPALAGGAIYVGSDDGTVYALDRQTGCARWLFQAATEVRTAIIVDPFSPGDHSATPLAYFGDLVGNFYAVNAINGRIVWRDHVDAHPSTTLSGSPVLFKDRIYVPVSSLEEGASDPRYPCCTFRGSIIAYDARTGRRIWQTYLMKEPSPQGINVAGAKMYGPSGAAIWNTPAVDEARGLLYFGTSDNYSSPANAISDAIVVLDLATGKVKWSYQATRNDAWNGGCMVAGREICPRENGPDYDFGASMILARTEEGKQLIVAGQKSGWVYALDPDTHTLTWKTKVGRGGIMGGVYFGMATHGNALFVPISDPPDGYTYAEPARPGLYALDLRTGRFIWKAPNAEGKCAGRDLTCSPGIAAAPTVTDDLVLTGGSDGWLRFYDSHDGSVRWRYDTTQSVLTVGGGYATGGSMGGATSPLPYHGTLIVESGYGFAGRMPGNVLLVFGVN
jgi:polyvinyl alcohol dehydrogenase (cytochrome)